MNRRNFLKNMAITAGSISPLFNMIDGLGLLSSTAYASPACFSDYKAIVVINLSGGNDAMNTFPPTGAEAYADYAEIRTNLAVKNVDLRQSEFYQVDDKGHYVVEPGGTSGDKQPYWPDDGISLGSHGNKGGQYTVGSYHARDTDGNDTGIGIHAFMPELAALYDNRKLSIVSNVGILIEPTTKDGIYNHGTAIPQFLFSHLHQARALARGNSDLNDRTGWAGRLADRCQVGGLLGLNLSLSGGGHLFSGIETKGLGVTGSGIPDFIGAGDTRSLLQKIAEIDESNHLRRVYNSRMSNSAKLVEGINDIMKEAPDFNTFSATNTYGDNLFDHGGDSQKFRTKLGMRTHHGLSSGLLNSLANTAKMIKLTKDNFGSNRHIFSVEDSGYDFHGGQFEAHTKRLRSMSMAVSDFYKVLEEMEMENEVLVVLTSEFGRTMKSNADGTDHGWGGHSFMLCGDPAFNGGNVFGEVMTDLSLNGVNAYTDRARIIPTTATEQMLAPALKWFGVDNDTMGDVFPNLGKFRTDEFDPESAFLQGVFS